MTRSRTLLAALAAICVFALVVVIATLVKSHIARQPESRRHDTARSDTAGSSHTATLTSHDSFSDDASSQREPPPEPNVFGTVVDQEGNPVEGARVTACHLVPYLGTEMSRKAMEGYDLGPEPEENDVRESVDESDTSSDTAREEPKAGPPWGMSPECLTDEEGRFALHVCDKLWYELSAGKGERESRARVFHEPQEGIRFVLYGKDALSSIALRVLDADTREPITRFTVTTSWLSREPWGEDTRLLRAVVQSENGEVCLEDVKGYVLSGMSIDAEGYVPYLAWGSDPAYVRTGLTVGLCRSTQLTGRVVWASSGDPVVGVGVRVDGRTPETRQACGFGDTPGPCLTDTEGEFSMSPVPAGRVVVSAYDASQGTFGGIADQSALVEKNLVLPPGQTTNVILELPGIPGGTSGHLSGRLADRETGEPAARVELCLESDAPPVGGSADAPGNPLTTTSDSDGAFSFDEVPLHEYRLRVIDYTYMLAENEWFCLRPGERIEGAVFELAKAARVEGHVTHASGAPAQAEVDCPSAETFGGRTDEEGYYSFDRVIPGRTLMSCTEMTRYVEIGDRLVDIPPGETTRVDFVVPETYTVAGRVTVAGAVVEDSEYRLASRLADTDVGEGFIELDGSEEYGGRFVLEDVPPGRYTLYATMKIRDSLDELVASMPVDVQAADVEVELKLPCICISGRVLDAASSEPVPGINVTIWREHAFGDPAPGGVDVQPSGAVSVFTDQDTGTYTIGPLGDGRYAVTASDDKYGAGYAEVHIVDGKLIGDPDIRLRPACEVRFSAGPTPPGAEIGFVEVTVRDTSGALVTSTWTGATMSTMFRSPSEHDELVLGYLVPGHYVLEADSPFAAWQSVQLEVSPDGKNLVEFRLPLGETLAVEVTNAGGKPVSGAIPDIKDALGRSRTGHIGHVESDWHVSLDNASNSKGLTRIEHLLPGTYTLTVRAAGYRTAEQQVTVLDADETRVKIVLERLPDE